MFTGDTRPMSKTRMRDGLLRKRVSWISYLMVRALQSTSVPNGTVIETLTRTPLEL